MKTHDLISRGCRVRGFTLPAVLVVAAALMILAVGMLLVAGIERSTARFFVDRQRAELAARAGLEEVRGMLEREASNDDFIILQSHPETAATPDRDPAPRLFLARGKVDDDGYTYRYVPLFSTSSLPPPSSRLAAPPIDPMENTGVALRPHVYQGELRVEWLPVLDDKGRAVARYGFWVEDLQGKVDPKIAGNSTGPDHTHARVKYPLPAVGAGDQVALFAIDPNATEQRQGALGNTLIKNRKVMISPDSALAAVELEPPLVRDASGHLADDGFCSVEETLAVGLHSYFEQPLVPFAEGIDVSVAGKPKLNLNRLLATGGDAAVAEMAGFIGKALPDFEKRKGGFPDDYLKTLAAGALDYADTDSEPTISPGSYLGLDAYPLLSEIVLHIDFQGARMEGDRWVLAWRFKLFAELWNMTNQPVMGGLARLSYEVNLLPETIGASAESKPFDDPSILLDPAQSHHNLTQIDGKFYGPEISVSLMPDEYRFYEFASVDYTLDFLPQFKANGQPKVEEFDLEEPELGARGITLHWNRQPVQVIRSIVRDAYGVSNFRTSQPRQAAKAAIPGHGYGPYGFFINNMGDPRIAHYLRSSPLGENAYPENISPNRRNIRRRTIYDPDPSPRKTRHFGRVMPSEWPDGGHDSPVGDFAVTSDNAVLPTDPIVWPDRPTPHDGNAPQRISNLGRFHSATELGRVYDPILWQPAYTDLTGAPGSGAEDTEQLLWIKYPVIPERRSGWPEVTTASIPSGDYGGGNTLRIGRPEHGRFDRPGERASQLLDLFQVGIPSSDDAAEREGEVVEIRGNINVNTAGEGALRAMAAGLLAQDPDLCRLTSRNHDTDSGIYGPPTKATELGAPTRWRIADRVAEAIMLRRPFASPSEMAAILDADGNPVFGNREMYDDPDAIQWTDAAAEEVFARVYDAATVRSRNFRVWVVGQALGGPAEHPEVLAEVRRVFTVFADPGERREDGSIDPEKCQLRVIHENDF